MPCSTSDQINHSNTLESCALTSVLSAALAEMFCSFAPEGKKENQTRQTEFHPVAVFYRKVVQRFFIIFFPEVLI